MWGNERNKLGKNGTKNDGSTQNKIEKRSSTAESSTAPVLALHVASMTGLRLLLYFQ